MFRRRPSPVDLPVVDPDRDLPPVSDPADICDGSQGLLDGSVAGYCPEEDDVPGWVYDPSLFDLDSSSIEDMGVLNFPEPVISR